ncbi:MAG: FAD binding domain-containing protein [Candidatus Palauibacterales bacterium]|nr:FAD binding domain-containing protein [Candidatus Palauibacterales bacterium]MDP2529939.1 FAD binding domain-containing protein [Candidatus Palauibacterales bacterium]MDP2583359.1 FAD binding domain-containing protein [Candidatus Palauibacterales bacterium]
MLRLHPYTYHRPSTVSEALTLLAEHAGDVMPIAGGTDLVPNMKHRLFTPGHLVALKGVEELHGIEATGDGGLRIGACETLDAVASDPVVGERYPALARACAEISGPQLRRMGTIGGNLCLDTRCTYYNQTFFWRKALGFCLKKEGQTCHVVPGGTRCVAAHSADTPPMLMVLGAAAEIAGSDGRRTLPVEEFFTSDGVWNRRMEPGELVTAILLPRPAAGTRTSFQKLRQRQAIDFPILNLAVAVTLDEGGVIRELRMVASAMNSYPRLIGRVQDAAIGNRLTPSVIDAVAEQAYRQCHPLENLVVDKEWRRAMVPVLVRQALGEIAA